MTIESQSIIERPHRFALVGAPPLQAIVRRLTPNSLAENQSPSHDLQAERFAELLDFSTKGIKLSLPFQANFDERLAVRLEFNELDYCFETEAIIRHVRHDGELWIAGCSIQPALPNRLVDYMAETAGKERRHHPRTAVSSLGFIKREGDSQAHPAEIFNLSEGGFAAKVVDRPLLSERVKFLVYDRSKNLKQITARIRWVKKLDQEDGYQIGVSFTEEHGYKTMRAALSPVIEPPLRSKRDQIGRFLIAGCLFAMLIPPLTSWGLGTLGQISVTNSIVEAEVLIDSAVPITTLCPETALLQMEVPTLQPAESSPVGIMVPPAPELTFESAADADHASSPYLLQDFADQRSLTFSTDRTATNLQQPMDQLKKSSRRDQK